MLFFVAYICISTYSRGIDKFKPTNPCLAVRKNFWEKLANKNQAGNLEILADSHCGHLNFLYYPH